MGSPWNFQFVHFAGLFSKGKQQYVQKCEKLMHM